MYASQASRPARFGLLSTLALALFLLAAPASLAASGDLSWYFSDDSSTHRWDAARSVEPAPNGTVYVAVSLGGAPTWEYGDIRLLRLKPAIGSAGPVVWARTWDDATHHLADSPIALTTDSSGNAIVAGQSYRAASDSDWVLIKWMPSGRRAWVARYGGSAHLQDSIEAVACDDAGHVYACGYRTTAAGGSDWMVVKFRASDGKRLWARAWSGTDDGAARDWPRALAVDGAGNSYTAGLSENAAGTSDILVMKVTPRGKVAWTRRIDGPAHGDDGARDVVLAGGRLFVAGNLRADGATTDLALLKYRTDGRRLWKRTWSPGDVGLAYASDLVVDRYGNATAVGNLYVIDKDSALAVSWSPSGTLRWSDVFTPVMSTTAMLAAAAADRSGTVWAAGLSSSGGKDDGMLLKYGANGSRRWVRSFSGDGTGDDWFNVLCLWGPGALAAVGSTQTGAGYYDLLAAKYVR